MRDPNVKASKEALLRNPKEITRYIDFGPLQWTCNDLAALFLERYGSMNPAAQKPQLMATWEDLSDDGTDADYDSDDGERGRGMTCMKTMIVTPITITSTTNMTWGLYRNQRQW